MHAFYNYILLLITQFGLLLFENKMAQYLNAIAITFYWNFLVNIEQKGNFKISHLNEHFGCLAEIKLEL